MFLSAATASLPVPWPKPDEPSSVAIIKADRTFHARFERGIVCDLTPPPKDLALAFGAESFDLFTLVEESLQAEPPRNLGRRLTREARMPIEDLCVGGMPRCKDLSVALPDSYWIGSRPTYVHPELHDWIRSHDDAAVAELSEYHRDMHDRFRHRRWQAMFDSTPPDWWSIEDTL